MRFAARFQFEIEPATAAAIREMADQITVVSAAHRRRTAEDAGRSHRADGIRLAVESELSRAIAPEVTNWPAALGILAALEEPVTFPLELAALLQRAEPGHGRGYLRPIAALEQR